MATKTSTKTSVKATASTAKRIKFAKFANKDGTLNGNVVSKIIRLRKQNLSWVRIADEIGNGCTPRMALRMYDARLGEGAHHGLLPGKGGRLPEPKHCAKCQNPKFNPNLEHVA
jgi:hypothetical protein